MLSKLLEEAYVNHMQKIKQSHVLQEDLGAALDDIKAGMVGAGGEIHKTLQHTADQTRDYWGGVAHDTENKLSGLKQAFFNDPTVKKYGDFFNRVGNVFEPSSTPAAHTVAQTVAPQTTHIPPELLNKITGNTQVNDAQNMLLNKEMNNIGANSKNIFQNQANIDLNAKNIGINHGGINGLQKTTDLNTKNIGINKDNITGLQKTAAGNYVTNMKQTGDIQANTQTGIENKLDILNQNKNIGANTHNIGANTQNIGANTHNINTNTHNIGANTQNINTNTQNIDANTQGINNLKKDGMIAAGVGAAGLGYNAYKNKQLQNRINQLGAQTAPARVK